MVNHMMASGLMEKWMVLESMVIKVEKLNMVDGRLERESNGSKKKNGSVVRNNLKKDICNYKDKLHF